MSAQRQGSAIIGGITVRGALAQSGLVPLDAQVLLAHLLGRDRAWLVAHGDEALPRERADAFLALARRRRNGEPVAYLTGAREFWGLTLQVSPAVLIPARKRRHWSSSRSPGCRSTATCACSI